YLAKFSSSGMLLWFTYYGGTKDDEGTSIDIDKAENVYMYGRTESANGIATNGSYQTAIRGTNTYNSFLSKFDSSGKLIWSTYYGDAYGSYPGAVICDKSHGYVYIAGETYGSTSLASSGAYQTSNAGGEDVYLAKFNGTGNLQWATYYGGIGDEKVSSLATDNFGNIYFTGLTSSPKGIATSGAFQTKYRGSTYLPAIYLAKFNNSGQISWATYYNTGNSSVALDQFQNIYLFGSTSDTNIATVGAYQTLYGGGDDAFIAKFGTKEKYDAGILSIQN